MSLAGTIVTFGLDVRLLKSPVGTDDARWAAEELCKDIVLRTDAMLEMFFKIIEEAQDPVSAYWVLRRMPNMSLDEKRRMMKIIAEKAEVDEIHTTISQIRDLSYSICLSEGEKDRQINVRTYLVKAFVSRNPDLVQRHVLRAELTRQNCSIAVIRLIL